MSRLDAKEVQRRQRTKSGILTEPEVARIKWRLAQGETPRQIAQDFDMSLWSIRAIARGDTWAWVEPDEQPVSFEPSFPGQVPEEVLQASQDRLARLLQEANEKRAQDNQAAEQIDGLSRYGIDKE